MYEKIRNRFYGMKQRCYNPNNAAYKNYGDRGIIICNEWLNDINQFIKWTLESGFKEDLIIDRIDNNDKYSPDNCRWVIRSQSNQNRRNKITDLEKKTRVCYVCKIKKPFKEFHKDKSQLGGIGRICKKCDNEKRRKYRKRRRNRKSE